MQYGKFQIMQLLRFERDLGLPIIDPDADIKKHFKKFDISVKIED